MGNSKTISLLQKFYNLPIARKTGLIPWFSLGALAIVVGSGSLILRQSLKSQLLQEAESQLAVTNIQYNIKIDQMGFGFRGQSDNAAIVAASELVAGGQSIDEQLRQQVSQILKNEITARNIEYATLVGKDKKIIVNANANRTGEIFDPDGLVSKVLQDPKQIKISQIVSWQELTKEKPPLPEGLKPEDTLIRYTVTPVFSSTNRQQVAGVLVSGDIVNGKSSIVEQTLTAFSDRQGYSAVYLRNAEGKYILATSMVNTGANKRSNIPLDDQKILDLAINNSTVSVRSFGDIQGESYALAATAITNDLDKNVAILVYGNPLSSINQILQSSLLTQSILAVVVLILIFALSKILLRAIAEPIQELQQVAQDFSEGNTQVRANFLTTDEVGILASTFNILADSIELNEKRLKEDAQRSRLLKEIAFDLGRAINVSEILQIVVNSSRTALGADRVIYLSFNDLWQGHVITESVQEGLPTSLGKVIDDPCLVELYANGEGKEKVKAIANIRQKDIDECYLKILEPFAATASLIVSVTIYDKLVGLLIVHQSHEPRIWEESDIELLSQIALQLGNAVEKAELLTQQKESEQQERQARENLQRRALELLMEVDPVSQGDLTVRVKVQEDEIGTIADSYNATIESLRKLVEQVQSAATLVSITTSDKDLSIQELSAGASAQTQEITIALRRIQDITESIKAVASNAAAAEMAVRQAVETVKAGDDAMNRTVEGFQGIRETVAETAKKVKRLGESSQKISKVVNVISNFADQTNLLALNASIEAAHAGEEGRGFAVVADEVRSLARQSAEATSEIEALVAEIQAETNEVVAAMESGTEQVVAGTKLVDETRYSLIQIADASNQIDQLVNAIAQATEKQSQDSELVSQTMLQVAAISGRTATEVNEVSASFKELLTVAQQLQENVSKFKVN
ncbi:MAG: methyl-accepting chemotaxis protein [Pleurocapsa sp.]